MNPHNVAGKYWHRFPNDLVWHNPFLNPILVFANIHGAWDRPEFTRRHAVNKISGPLLDRIDLHVEVTPVAFSELSSTRQFEKSESIRERVIKARDIQEARYKDNDGVYANAQMSSKMLKEICVINTASQHLLKIAMEKLNLSARAYDRILKVSRTIADLSGSEDIKAEHLAEAIQYRSLDREGWGG